MKNRNGFCKFILFILLLIYSELSFTAENIFYALRYNMQDRMTPPLSTMASLKKNYKKISILIPQAYSINESGIVSKGVEPVILQFAQQHAMKIMPLVTNTKFNTDIVHQFLLNPTAQSQALKTLIDLCKHNHFYGLQFDFEMVNIKDRDALTHFYLLAAKELHKNNLKISFAVAPVVTNKPMTLFLQKIYNNWEGAYDLKALGNAADFVSIMAYNQHGGPTTPGSTADLPWINQTIKYALHYIPAHKISIGLPDFSTHWFTGSAEVDHVEKVRVQMHPINYKDATKLATKNKITFVWDNKAGSYYAIFSRNWLNEYLFLENYKSFNAKYKLVNKYNLHGISIFDLGTEDPRIWDVL